MSNYCAYHRHDLHKTSHCKELKKMIQDLFDNGIIQKSKLSTTKDSTLKKDQHHETKSSNGLNVTLISSHKKPPSKVSYLSNTYSPKKELVTPLVDYVYPQRLPLKENQANRYWNTSLFSTFTDHTSSCPTMPMKSTPTNFPSELQEPIMQTLEIDLNTNLDTPSSFSWSLILSLGMMEGIS